MTQKRVMDGAPSLVVTLTLRTDGWATRPVGGLRDQGIGTRVRAAHEFGPTSQKRDVGHPAFAIPTHDAKARHGWGTQLSGNANIRNGWVGHPPPSLVVTLTLRTDGWATRPIQDRYNVLIIYSHPPRCEALANVDLTGTLAKRDSLLIPSAN
jgi:hypothetical protein